MYKVLKAETLAAKIHLMVVHAPRVASHCLPGQFIIAKLDEKGERIPLTICDYDQRGRYDHHRIPGRLVHLQLRWLH